MRLGGDYMTPLAAAMSKDETGDQPIALVVIDEITHRTPPFSETPEVAWTPYLGKVIAAIDDAGAKVIGLDMIYPKTLAGRALAPGYDRTFLQALAQSGRAGRLVLAEARLSATPILPYEGQIIAVGGRENVRPVHLTPDRDNVVRRHPVSFALEDGERIRSFAAELSVRSGVDPQSDILINFSASPERFPAYRFSDVYACIAAGKTEAFEVLSNKTVLIGTALDIEDRHVAGDRLRKDKTPPVLPSPCKVGTQIEPLSINRASIPGLFIEARATDTFMNGTSLNVPGRPARFLIALVLLGAFALCFFHTGPSLGFGVFAVSGAALWGAGGIMLSNGVLAPILPLLLAGAVLFVSIYSYRFILEDKAKRWITHAFAHYLSPALVQKLADNPEALKLGGERRRVAVLFADLAGFTTVSEKMADDPQALVAHLNAFFDIMTKHIEHHGGYVDKYIGDSVMGIWGAPVAIEAPERAAAEAAQACLDAVDEWNAKKDEAEPKIMMRIGISAGEVVAGNLGSKKRFNYTVIGDAVNRASRLEQENKRLGTRILVDGEVADQLPENFAARFIEEVQLRGQSRKTKLYALGGAQDG